MHYVNISVYCFIQAWVCFFVLTVIKIYTSTSILPPFYNEVVWCSPRTHVETRKKEEELAKAYLSVLPSVPCLQTLGLTLLYNKLVIFQSSLWEAPVNSAWAGDEGISRRGRVASIIYEVRENEGKPRAIPCHATVQKSSWNLRMSLLLMNCKNILCITSL